MTRRQLLATAVSASGAALRETPRGAGPGDDGPGAVSFNGRWLFRLDPDDRGIASRWQRPETPLESWRDVEVPHTWQVEPENAEYMGIAWYRRVFEAPQSWSNRAVRIEFEAVFHTATVWVNGVELGRHIGKGYTAFTFDMHPALRFGALNVVVVRVDNAFNDSMLPRGRSSDWAHDGGIYRPVRALITPKVFFEHVWVDADPDLVAGSAIVHTSVAIRNASATRWEGVIGFRIVDDETGLPVATNQNAARVALAAGETATVSLAQARIAKPKLWHFDHPHLYRYTAELARGHELSTMFGVRKIEIRNRRFYLNGEAVRLMGVERMAGSNPLFGMSEPSEWIDHDHADLKNLNCVYTRVHWPQDKRVLDWCDRNGIFIQTEVPAWGPNTFRGMPDQPDQAVMTNGLEQLREMVARDRNHPCIFSWGVCNEINGQNPPAYAFAKRMYEEAKRIDPARLVSYASHSLFHTPEKDVSGVMDYIMFNQYYGSWQKGGPEDLAKTLDGIHSAFPDKAIVISEYGYCACTADRPEGDEKRIEVLETQDPVLRERDFIAGVIFFDYNDYRTHVGDRGTGVMKQRVHGVVDLYGMRKASYDVLRRESSPIERLDLRVEHPIIKVTIQSRSTMPAYTLRNYFVRAIVYGQGSIPVERAEAAVPTLAPGETQVVSLRYGEPKPLSIQVDVLRSGVHSVQTAIWKI